MALFSDFHNHVARSSARVMAEAAQARGLYMQGFSEHIFQMAEARSLLAHLALEGPLLTFTDYIASVMAAGEGLSLKLLLGLEVDFIPDKNAAIQALLQQYPWDFLIGSVHEIDGLLFESYTDWQQETGEAAWLRYFALLRQAIESGFFSVVSHPVRMRYSNPFLPSTLDEELEQLAALATSADVALEINGYDLQFYPDMVHRLALACQHQKTPVSVGSDAHLPKRVAEVYPQVEAVLREVGITSVRVWQQREPLTYTF